MSNQYTIQLRTPQNDFIVTLDNRLIMGSVSFSRTIDNGYGDMRIRYSEKWTEGTFVPYRIVKVYQGSSLIYRGYVADIEEFASGAGEYIEAKIIGLQALLNNSKYEDGMSGVVNINDDPVNIINIILGQHNTNVGWTMFDASSLPLYGTHIHMQFDNMNALDSIKEVAKQIGYIVDFMPDGTIRFFEPDISVIDHPIVYGLHTNDIKKKKKTTEMVNKITLKYNDGSSVASGDNLNSQAKYGIVWRIITDNRIKNSTTANLRIATELQKGAEPILQLEMTIQNNYTNSINIGDTVATKNKEGEYYGPTWGELEKLGLTRTDFEVGGVYESTRSEALPKYPYIAKIDYQDTYKTITLGDYDSLSKSLSKL